MSISTYAELKTAVSNWLARDDTANYIDNIILVAEKWIYRNVRTRDMETALNVTVTGSTGAVPTGYIETKYAIWNSSKPVLLKPKPVSWIREKYPSNSGAGIPSFFGVEGSNFVFGKPASDGTMTGIFYKNLGNVSDTAHALFTNNPDLYLFASLAECMAFTKNDSRIQLWSAKRDEIKNSINIEAKNSHFSDALTVSIG